MNPIAAGVAGAVISGVAMYTVGATAAHRDAPTTGETVSVQAVDKPFVPASYTTALRPVESSLPSTASVRNTRRATTARVPANDAVEERDVVRDEREIAREDDRSWGKTAMVVGGSAAGGAGVGGIVGGKKGALIGAAIGGGAASIYEATQRR